MSNMTPFNGDMTQALKWMQNNAPNIQAMINQKAAWYSKYNDQFWSNWQSGVYDLRTAGPFGFLVWCIILGVPSQLFGLYPVSNGWAFGANRQNFIYSGGAQPSVNQNTVGGNFAGGGATTILNLNEVRWALQLRYVALVSNGNVKFINRMLQFIFNGGQPWNYPNKKYFYLMDSTGISNGLTNVAIFSNGVQVTSGVTVNATTGAVTFTTAPASGAILTWTGTWDAYTTPSQVQFGTGNGSTTAFTIATPRGAVVPVANPLQMEYRIGAGMNLSSQFVTLLNSPQYGIVPSCAGTKYTVIQES